MLAISYLLEKIESDGFAIVPGIFSPEQVTAILAQLETAIAADRDGAALRAGGGTIYAARNILTLWPGVTEIWKQKPLRDILGQVLGNEFGLVRVLYFDKPPGQSWALPWHKDTTIAVRENRLPSSVFCKPTTKISVPHVEAPKSLLERMLTVRIHLDTITEENGPLKVIPGSHRGVESQPPQTILTQAGDVLLIRPLVSHCSNRSDENTSRHRRILHLEFAGVPDLSDGYAWHDFVLGVSSPTNPE